MKHLYELNKPLKAIVFNHTEYDNGGPSDRSGEPGQQLVACLRDDLQITDIDHKVNLTKSQVISALMELSYIGDEYSGLIICVLSHGGIKYDPLNFYTEEIHARDMTYTKHELWKNFETQDTWKDKPILIFIQACRGRDPTPGVMATFRLDALVIDEPKFTIPKYPNLFIMNASQPGTVSFRLGDTTPFIDALIDVLKERATTWDLLSMATDVCHRVATNFEACHVLNKEHDDYKCSLQMPCFETTLTKKFYFPICETKDNLMVEEYKIEKKGLALVFLYDYEGTEHEPRYFVKYDEEILEQTLKSLNFDVKFHHNMKSSELIEQLNDVPRFEKYDMAMIVFSGYGEKDDLIFPDSKIGLYNLWQSLLGHKCPQLLQKPKVVIISASSTKHENPLVEIEGVSGKFDSLYPDISIGATNVDDCTDGFDVKHNIPVTADLLLCFESAAGRTRCCNGDYSGTAYFKYLCDALMDEGNTDFMSALTATHMKFKEVMDEKYENDHEFYRETPIFFSTLRKSIPIRK